MSTDPSPEQMPETVRVPEQRRHRPACPHCGGGDITKGLKLDLSAGVAGEVGIEYRATGKFLGMALLGNEPLHLDVCNSCGTVTRIYVQETQRKWK
jgi:hypothetical protein